MAHQLHQELRHIKASHLTHLSTIIDQSKSWNDLLNQMSNGRFPSLCITLESAHLIKRQISCDKSPTFALLNHWAITGRRRPTIKDLIELLRSCDLKRAEDFVWLEILHRKPVEQQITQEPLKLENNQACHYTIPLEYKFENLDSVVPRLLERSTRYSFDLIYKSTNRFCHRPLYIDGEGGFKIGDGRFSTVFLATTTQEGTNLSKSESTLLAAKLLKSECNIDYLVNEINLASKITHENILELLGLALGHDGGDHKPSYICLIYPFIRNGSLLECLSNGLRCNNLERIPWSQRLNIALKVAEGIAHLHTFHEGVIIHRDIKTANILIGENLNPKLGDFTLVRQLDSFKQDETQYSQNIIGTSVYMPPEAFRGDISTKFDIFSFGIVVLELLTGLKPFDEVMNEDLLTYVSDKLSDIEDMISETSLTSRRDTFLRELLDKKAGEWNFDKAKVMFDLALKATEVRKRDRPEISEILSMIRNIYM